MKTLRHSKPHMRGQAGLTMIETMVILLIGLALMAMVAPLVSSTLNSYRLRTGASNYANMLQTARTKAVINDTYYPVYANAGTLAATGGQFNAFVDMNGTGLYATAPLADLAVAFNPMVVIQAQAAAPNTGAAGLYSKFLPGIAFNAVNVNPAGNPWGPTFGSRGLPCIATAPAGGTCSYADVLGRPIAFETFLWNNFTNRWEAVTVNPSGRVRLWQYDTLLANWTPLN